DGVVLIGEPYWTEPLPAGVDPGFPAEEFADLAGTAEKLRAAGLDLVEMVLADGDSWDRYAAAQWWTLDEWLRGHPEHPHRGQVESFLDDARREHLTWQRRCLGWGVFVCRPRP
nr:SAM-dependent methyltransferase [Geodermatophilaceae bacterium]